MQAQRPTCIGRHLFALIGAELAGAILVYRLGSVPWARVDWGHLGQWLRTTSPDEAVVAVLRVTALAGTAWLLTSTLAYSLARIAGGARLARLTGCLTLPAIRTLVDTAIAASVVGAALGGGVAAYAAGGPPTTAPPVVIQIGGQSSRAEGPAAPPPHVYVPVPAGDPRSSPPYKSASAPPTTSATTTTTTALPSTSDDAAAVPASGPAAPTLDAVEASPVTYVVRAGDNLWTIAAHHLADTTGRPVVRLGRGEIARYWLAVIDANRGKLPSGDPNLIHPGERVLLPASGA